MAIFVSRSQLGQYDMPERTKLEVSGADGKDLSVVLIPMVTRSVADWEKMAHEGKEIQALPEKTEGNIVPFVVEAEEDETDKGV